MGMFLIQPTPQANMPAFYAELTSFSAGSPPERPQPGPGGPRPEHPISLPGDPGFGEIPGVGGPGGGLPIGPGHPDYPTRPQPQPPGPGVGQQATVMQVPPTDPPTPPPAGMPAGSTQVMIWFGPGTQPASAWVAPYASTGPVTEGQAQRLQRPGEAKPGQRQPQQARYELGEGTKHTG